MSKRGAGSELTHDNWDEEEDAEEAGTFTTAKKEVLQRREIKKAKRKGAAGESNGDSEDGPAPFKGFAGFAPTAASKNPQFSFNMKMGQNWPNTSTINTSSIRHEGGTTCTTTDSEATTKKSISSCKAEESTDQTAKYLHQLKSLNQSVTKWISDHVDKNPYCILTPIFTDYDKHLAELEKRYPNHSKKLELDDTKEKNGDEKNEDSEQWSKEDQPSEDKKSAVASPPPNFTFGAAATSANQPNTLTTASDTSLKSSSGTGIFGSNPASSSTSSSIFGGFGGMKSDGAAGSGFSFAVKSSSQASTSSAQGDGAGGTEEEEYVPPKNEVEAVKEDDAYYMKRCKLYYKKGESWADRGVGNLYLKKCEDQKTALLVRADTALGNILLNILVVSSMPVNRQGKNNVMLSCIPNPPIDEKKKDDKTPVSMLIRVKTAEDADELFEKMNAAKNESG